MRQARGLVPYALVGALVLVASLGALVLATGGASQLASPAASRSPSAPPSASRQPVSDLSPLGRLANADNSRRRSVAKADTPAAITKTRWSADGSAVAYIESGTRLVVVRVDGTATTYALTPALRQDGYRIVDDRFSPSGTRIAATIQKVNSSQSDVYLANVN